MTEPTSPAPTHLDARDPGKPRKLDIREEIDRELDAYPSTDDLVLLVPEDCWDDLTRQLGEEAAAEEASYNGVRLKKAAVSAVVAQDGF
ncbi:hypothetical protein [Phenylobacterium sp.]|jgi:hypothetical protein|uniref:hypothetical protein n=1 Tax=Phenylobacterium sp. TaxID=1871053 RepID=UPI002E366CF0|nr:hypothetical protein [Phenylobacterium sp.]HEX2559923.1 hypothetical protein [Phenylobacterium sp.]